MCQGPCCSHTPGCVSEQLSRLSRLQAISCFCALPPGEALQVLAARHRALPNRCITASLHHAPPTSTQTAPPMCSTTRVTNKDIFVTSFKDSTALVQLTERENKAQSRSSTDLVAILRNGHLHCKRSLQTQVCIRDACLLRVDDAKLIRLDALTCTWHPWNGSNPSCRILLMSLHSWKQQQPLHNIITRPMLPCKRTCRKIQPQPASFSKCVRVHQVTARRSLQYPNWLKS